ncbi:zinc-ribbon domain-containing protein [Arthrobacter koreensis]|uniref:zinc-ribbon domain-containing protein n=1 Tax=Arthrobacter koreensis TaxID=199136 RepID=UPI0036DCF2CF
MKNADTAATTAGKTCSTPGCEKAPAFHTRTKPAWCLKCIDKILLNAGLKACEPFQGYNEWRLTSCIDCGVQAHYKLSYTVEGTRKKTCEACHWKEWTEQHGHGQIYTRDEVAAHAAANGYELVSPLVSPTGTNDPVAVHCLKCGRRSASRVCDLSWKCTCSRNIRSATPSADAPAAPGKKTRNLLFESSDPAVAWWDRERNDEKTFPTVTLRATRACHWKCPDCSHNFSEKVLYMTGGNPQCPECRKRDQQQWDEQYETWKRTPIASVPELAAAWADEGDPRRVMVASHGLRRFSCPKGHHPRVSPTTFLRSGCPSCRAAETLMTQKNWLADVLPEVASQWHPDRNGKMTPQAVVWDSKRTVWWRSECCGAEWQQSPRDRDKYERLRCPECRTILGSLAWQDPGLAAEWSPANPVSAWHIRPNAKTLYTPEWICATDPGHVWTAPLVSRSNGAGCPDCKDAGKSKVELDHCEAAKTVFTSVRSGAILRSKAFTTRTLWTADILAAAGDRKVVIEYDGEYWHKAPAKAMVDERKSMDLLAAGYAVVRLREDDLPSLSVTNPRYREIRVYSTAPRPEAVMAEISAWVSQLQG